MNITVIEANMTGTQHSYPNGIYVKILSEIAKPDYIDLYCSREHLKCMGIQENEANIVFHPISVVSGNQHMIKKFFTEYLNTMRILSTTKNRTIFFLSQCPDIQLPVLRSAKKWKDKRIIIFTHGELEGLLAECKWKIWSYPFWISRCFKKDLPDNIFRIVLGKAIKNYLDYTFHYQNIFYINQPRDRFMNTNNMIPMRQSNVYGYVGDCSELKGGMVYAKASNMVEKFSQSQFMIVGRCIASIDEKKFPKVLKTTNMDNFLPFNKYDEYIERLTYVCLPYPSNTYRLTASGAVLDAVRYLKPLIYIKNDYFDGIFSDFGDIGYRCENNEDFIETIRKIDENPDVKRYKCQVENMRKVQDKFSIANVTEEIIKIIDTTNNR